MRHATASQSSVIFSSCGWPGGPAWRLLMWQPQNEARTSNCFFLSYAKLLTASGYAHFCATERGELAPDSVIAQAISSHPLLRAMLLAPGNFHRLMPAPMEWNYLLYHVLTGTLLGCPWPIHNFTSTISVPDRLVWTGPMSNLTRTLDGCLSDEDDGMPDPPPNIILRHIMIPTRQLNAHKDRNSL